jgi:hypothetical protein
MKKVIRLTESDLMRLVKRVIKEQHVSYLETQGRLNEFAESLKTHLERNGYNVFDSPKTGGVDVLLKGNKRNIVFSYYKDNDYNALFVYFENDNDEAEDSILRYWDSIKNELGIRGLQGLRGAHSYFFKFQENELGWSEEPSIF